MPVAVTLPPLLVTVTGTCGGTSTVELSAQLKSGQAKLILVPAAVCAVARVGRWPEEGRPYHTGPAPVNCAALGATEEPGPCLPSAWLTRDTGHRLRHWRWPIHQPMRT